MTVTKRPLPPTPSTGNNNNRKSVIDMNYENAHYNDLLKSLEQKESTINNLKIIVMEWKKKAVEYETAYNEVKQRLEEKEKFLMKQHQAEIDALTKAQVDQTNENLDLILKLENENKMLKQQLRIENTLIDHPQQQPSSSLTGGLGYTSQLCDTAETANQTANSAIVEGRKHSDELIERINEMMNAMEGRLHGFNNYKALEETTTEDTNTTLPPLVGDTFSSSEEDNQSIEVMPTKQSKKKISIKIKSVAIK
ncbi:hypothetical protein G6F48_002437 [Rhizopus delemar]|nr:hypothetical protein G6F48_002437 [Rhizopus delemar]